MQIIMYDPKRMSWDGKNDQFSFYISDVKDFRPEAKFMLQNRQNGNRITFELGHRDMDGSNEDCYGYNYRSIAGAKRPCRLLVINT